MGHSLPKTDIGASNPAYNEPAGVQSTFNTRQPGETFPESGTGVARGPVDGVNDLGTASTNDVVRLPEERTNPEPLAAQPATGNQTQQSKTSKLADTVKDKMPGTTSNQQQTSRPSGNTTTSDSYEHPVGLGGRTGTHHDMTHPSHTGGTTGANYDVDHGLGLPHTRTSPRTEQPSLSDDSRQASAVPSDQAMKESVPSPKEAGYPTGKPSAMDKIKGTMLEKKGKMFHHEEEIKQGQMLKETGQRVNVEEEIRRGEKDV